MEIMWGWTAQYFFDAFFARLKDRYSLLGCQRDIIGDRVFSDLKQVLLFTYGFICDFYE